jgi:hypothetical protein
MKKIIQLFAATIMMALICGSLDSYGQSQPSQPTDKTSASGTRAPKTRRLVSDQNMKSQMQSDLASRNSDLRDNSVNWWDSGNGYYYGTYSINDADYMARYDQTGKYIETYKKGTWDSDVPSNLKTSFDQSPYANQQVVSYWTSNDPNKSGYYMELRDNSGKNTNVWVDSSGKFSTTAPSPAPAVTSPTDENPSTNPSSTPSPTPSPSPTPVPPTK